MQKTDGGIAGGAQKTANLPRRMVVIHHQQSVIGKSAVLAATDGTATLLADEHLAVLL